MHLLMSTIPMEIPKWMIEDIISNYESVHHVTWIPAENGRATKSSNDFMIVGSKNSMFTYEEENLLMVKIEGVENAKNILKDINNIESFDKAIHQFIIPVIV